MTILSRLSTGALAGFPKSRVYAKLLTGLISKGYQTFNRQTAEVGPDTA
jgi:hypothetical protein